MILQAKDLGWKARGRPIVSNVDLELTQGEVFGLIGPNGSGKSTLLRLLAGLLPAPDGQVLLQGKPLDRLSRRDVAQRIALVGQHADTSEALSVRQAVELGRTPWLSAFAPFGPQDHAVVTQSLQALEILPLADRLWSSLSGGERQRVQIAKALAQRPTLLILDEPTNHLDIHHQLALLQLAFGLGITVVMALHDLNQAMLCDRVGVMQDGRLLACGPPGSVVTPDCLSRVFRVGARPMHDPYDARLFYRFHIPEEKS